MRACSSFLGGFGNSIQKKVMARSSQGQACEVHRSEAKDKEWISITKLGHLNIGRSRIPRKTHPSSPDIKWGAEHMGPCWYPTLGPVLQPSVGSLESYPLCEVNVHERRSSLKFFKGKASAFLPHVSLQSLWLILPGLSSHFQ